MDGNGRWASKRGLPRLVGHQRGLDVLHDIIEYAHEAGIAYISAWAFSTANWNRPQEEISGLMKLLRRTIQKDLATFHKRNARLKIIGDRAGISPDLIELIEHAEASTKDNDAITVLILFNYDGRSDILQATNRFYQDEVQKQSSSSAQEIKLIPPTPEQLANYLLTANIPEPDLVIRTSGLTRISNYMIWQCAFSEYYFSEKLWPDFKRDDFQRALDFYQGTERKFGHVNAKAAQ